MGLFNFTRKKKLPHEKSYPALVDLAVYIKNLQTSLDDPNFQEKFSHDIYIDTLMSNKKKTGFMHRLETIDTLKNALVELAINIKAFQEELDALPDIRDKES